MYFKTSKLGLKALLIMLLIETKALRNNKRIIYAGLLNPILYFIFFSFGIHATFGNIIYQGIEVSFLSYSMIGIIAMCIFREMYQCIYRMVNDKRWGLLSLKIFNGVRPFFYIMGISTFPLIGVTTQSIVVYILANIFGEAIPISNFIIILIFLLFCIIFWSSFLICIVSLIKNYKQRDFIMNTLMLPILFSAPLFFSFENAHQILQTISSFNPLKHQLDAMRSIAFGNPEYTTIIIVVSISIITSIISCFVLKNIDFNNTEY
jgi:ABC-2 type transport system permease protein